MKSDNVKKGMQQAPHRSLFNALGFTEEEMNKPMVGIVSSYNEIVPGHMNLDKIVNAVKLGVAEAGGVPVVFPAIAVCDGIAMGHIGMKYSLVTRDLIADSTECMALAHQFDALVMVPNCDKNVPGLLMAAARINVPTVFVSGGPMLAGHVQGKKRSLSSMFEAVGSYAAGTMTEDDVREYEEKVCPTCGSCSGMYTANSMNCLTEALGMGLRGNGTIPAVYSERIKLAKHAGMAVMDMYRKNIRPRDIMTKDAILNALTVDMALGCSTNSMLHLPAIAHEIGFDFDIAFANPISEKTPNLCHLAPAGPTYMEDLNEAGGVYAVMKELADIGLLNTDCMTVTGKTVGENIANAVNKNPEVIRPVDNPYSKTGGLAVLKGNLAPDGSVVKRSAVCDEMMVHEGPARVFDCEEDAIAAIGEVTLDGEEAITAARSAYEALEADVKAKVTNLSDLVVAEKNLALLKAEKESQDKDAAAAASVSSAITAIGEVTLDKRGVVAAARAAYDTLSDVQKSLVTNYSDLQAAESRIAALVKEAADKAEADKAEPEG